MAATIAYHRLLFLPTKPYSHIRRTNSAMTSPPLTTMIRSARRSDFDAFAGRISSGEALRDAWRRANEGIEFLAFEARRAAERIDRRYAVSRRIGSASRAAVMKVQEIDFEIGISRRWRSFYMDLFRNWPRYRRELSGIFRTPIGRWFTMAFFFWLALSGWLFRFFIIATWILPFAAPLLVRAFTNSFALKGVCPACKRPFVGYRNQVISCAGCRNIVWQPGESFFKNRSSPYSKPSEADIIDIELEDK